MKMSERLERLEGIVQKHLEESGEIRTTLKECKMALDSMKDVPADNKWLKKFLWIVLAAPLTTEVARHIWK
jgi:hypothetical protein